MAAEMRSPSTYSTLKTLFKQWPIKKKAFFGSILLIAAILLILAVHTYKQADYRLLYTNLTPEDYISLSNWLALNDIDFKNDNNHRSIYVSSDRIHQTRLEMAQYKLPRSLDNSTNLIDSSTSAVVDAITVGDPNIALQLELAKTIATLDHIQSARVHLGQPSAEYSLGVGPSATVVLGLAPGRTLTPSQLQGVLHLLSASVSGLQPSKINIFDNTGSVLSSGDDFGTTHLFPGGTLAYQAAVEGSLEKKAQDLVDTIIGKGQALIKVTAELDFAKNETTSEHFDPDEPVVRSEHIQQEPAADSNADDDNTLDGSLAGTVSRYQPLITTSSKYDYEIGKTVTKTIQPVGVVKQLTVTILVGDQKSIDPDGSFRFQERNDEELDSIKSLVSAVLSLKPDRGDSIQLLRAPGFMPADDLPRQKVSLLYQFLNFLPVGSITFFAVVFLLFYFLILKPVIVLLRREIDILDNGAAYEHEDVSDSATIADQDELAAILKKEIENNPGAAAHVIKRWIQET